MTHTVEANLASPRLEQVPVVNLRRHPGSEVPSLELDHHAMKLLG